MTTPHGRDDRPLIDSYQAAYSLGMDTRGQFREWARRRGITPVAHRPNPVRGQPIALYDPADIGEAIQREHEASHSS